MKGYIKQAILAISIHAPRVGSDGDSASRVISAAEFLSTLPAWGATQTYIMSSTISGFLSTLPAWGATR